MNAIFIIALVVALIDMVIMGVKRKIQNKHILAKAFYVAMAMSLCIGLILGVVALVGYALLGSAYGSVFAFLAYLGVPLHWMVVTGALLGVATAVAISLLREKSIV